MSVALVIPLLSAVGIALLSTAVHRRVRPQPLRNEGIWSSTIAVGVMAVALSAAVQAHHAVGLLVMLCAG